ncbi:MAG TPA: DUF2917 domain-containing protein [Burkholderiales bacterium]|nr:DUF2917 domain-containing protein [Burkholderiales bacterium]
MDRPDDMVQGSLDLARGSLVRIVRGRGMLVRVLSGSVWITEEGDPRDRFIAAGARLAIGSNGITLVSALAPTTISLTARRRRNLGARLVRAWQSWFVPGARPTTAPL